MTIQVTGVLLTPMNTVSRNTKIRVTSKDSSGETVQFLPAEIITNSAGAYDFALVDGTHTIEVNFSKKYNLVGTVTITPSTSSPLTLIELLNL